MKQDLSGRGVNGEENSPWLLAIGSRRFNAQVWKIGVGSGAIRRLPYDPRGKKTHSLIKRPIIGGFLIKLKVTFNLKVCDNRGDYFIR